MCVEFIFSSPPPVTRWCRTKELIWEMPRSNMPFTVLRAPKIERRATLWPWATKSLILGDGDWKTNQKTEILPVG